MNKLLSQLVLVSSTSAMLLLFILTLGTENQEMLMSVAAILIILLSIIIERLLPFRRKWNENEGDTIGDVASFVLIFGLLETGLKFFTPFVLLLLLGNWSTELIDLPLWQQTIMAGLMIELGAYISHYLHHNNKFLWQLHAMHHSPKRLYTLNNFRFHPLNHIINHLVMILPPLLLGFSAQAILAYTAISMPILLLQHSNIDFNFGKLNTVINTSEVHRWHHSNREHEGNSNYGRATLIWDRIFGTYYFPQELNSPNELGLFSGSSKYPQAMKFFSQLWYPFSRQCCSSTN